MNRKIPYYIYIVVVVAIAVMAGLFFACQGCNKQPEETPTPATESIDTLGVMLMQIQRCSRLNTAEYKVHKVITYDDKKKIEGKMLGKDISIDLPIGKRKVAIPLYATIQASIDLTNVTEDDMVIIGDHIEVFLPQPTAEITETHIDHEGIKQYVSMTRSNFTDEEMQGFELQGRKAIEKDMAHMDIIEMAKKSAARQVIPIITMMGFEEKNIVISFRDNETNKITRHNR